jgi:salicylate hydroxylase
VQRYAELRWQRNAQVQERAIRNGRIFHAQGPLSWGRDLAMGALGARVMDVPWLYRGL